MNMNFPNLLKTVFLGRSSATKHPTPLNMSIQNAGVKDNVPVRHCPDKCEPALVKLHNEYEIGRHERTGPYKFMSGMVVRHFKRETVEHQSVNTHFLYRIVCTAHHSETDERMMVYEALYGSGKTCVRPYDMFMSEVDHEKYPEIKQKFRFEPANMADLLILNDLEGYYKAFMRSVR